MTFKDASMREGRPKSFEGKMGERVDDPLSEAGLKMKEVYIGRIKRTMDAGRADWSGYEKLVRLANTDERDWDVADRARQDFPGWTQEDFARLVKAIDSDPRYQELLSERNQSREQPLDSGHEVQPKSFEGETVEHRDGPSSEDYLEMKHAYINHIEETTYSRGGTDWGGYDKLVRLANTKESEWNTADRASEDFPGWKQQDFAKLVSVIDTDPTFRALLKTRKEFPDGSSEKLERQELFQQYNSELQNYHDLVLELRRAQKKGRIDTDPELKAEMEAIDHERHEIHLKLLEIAKRFGRNADHVLVDIVRMEGTLATYGLPEFSLLVSEDVVDKSPAYDTHAKEWRFNVDTKAGKVLAPRSVSETEKMPLPQDRVVIVFGVAGVFGNDETGRVESNKDSEQGQDFFIREQRAKDFAKQIGGKYFDHSDSSYFHSQTMAVVGVEIPKAELERAAKVIRDNPTKFRLGERYYSADELSQMEMNQHSNDED